MKLSGAFGVILPRTADRGLSWARAQAGEVFAAHGDGAVVREVVRDQVRAHARELTAVEIDDALDWAAARVRGLHTLQMEQYDAIRAFELRATAVLETEPASRCGSARRRLLAEEHGLTPEQALVVLDRVAPSCLVCAAARPVTDSPRAAAGPAR